LEVEIREAAGVGLAVTEAQPPELAAKLFARRHGATIRVERVAREARAREEYEVSRRERAIDVSGDFVPVGSRVAGQFCAPITISSADVLSA
jgi:hypothetical protein